MSGAQADAQNEPTTSSPSSKPSLSELFAVFGKIGLISFGGPAGQIALMHRILVDEKRWISDARFLHALNYCMLLPGPEAQQLATYTGWLLQGWRGGVLAGLLFILPGFFVICALSVAYALFQSENWFEVLFFGLKAAVLAIVIQALVRLAGRALKTPLAISIAALAFVAIYVFAVPFPLIILVAAIVGVATAKTWQSGGGAQAADDDVLEDISRPKNPLRQALTTLVLGLGFWVAPVLLFVLIFGASTVFTDLAIFFSKLAVVTFGGAYAVLAYVAQEAVSGYGWLSSAEMLDGLAMAETTPGPLIIILTFVGFIAGFRDATGLDPLTAGLLGAFLTTWVTFAPCFLWIFLGAPYVEGLRGNTKIAAALAAITAAVVGVILNLAVWFTLNVLFRQVAPLDLGPIQAVWPEFTSLDPAAVVLSVIALVLTFVMRLGTLLMLAILAALGGLAAALGLI